MPERSRYRFDENKLKPLQREAALALVEYEFTPKAERKTKEEIAEEVGVTRMCLWKWDKQDDNFIEYKKYLAAQHMESYTALVYARLIESIDKRYSVKAMELFMKRLGDLNDNTEITIKNGSDEDKTHDERLAELKKRLAVEDSEQAAEVAEAEAKEE